MRLAPAGVDRAADIEQRVLSLEHEPGETERVAIEREPDIALIAQLVVEEGQPRVLGRDARVNRQLGRHGKRAANVDRAADDRARIGRDLGRKELQIRIERRLEQPEEQRRVRPIVQGDAARPGDLQTIGHRLELIDRHRLAAHGDPAVHLADALVARVQIRDGAVEFVHRVVEVALAARFEREAARERRLRHLEVLQRFDRNLLSGGGEHVGVVPADPGVARDAARPLRHVHRSHPKAVAFERELRRRRLERLAPGHAGIDPHLAGTEQGAVRSAQVEIGLGQPAIDGPVVQAERGASTAPTASSRGPPAPASLPAPA